MFVLDCITEAERDHQNTLYVKLNPGRMNPSKPKHQPSCDEQRLMLRYNMATIVSTLNLRLYAMQQQQLLKDDESDVFEKCFERLAALLEQWKTLE